MANAHRASSIASSTTLRATPLPRIGDFSRSVTAASEDVNMMDIDSPLTEASSSSQKKFYIAVDYGTTYSAVSFVAVLPGEDPEMVSASTIENIVHFPKDPLVYGQIAREAPTEICYLERTKKRNHFGESEERSQPWRQGAEQNGNTEHEDSDDAPPYEDDDSEEATPAEDIQWGYMVQDMLGRPNEKSLSELRKGCLRRVKLLLDDSEYTRVARNELDGAIEHVKNDLKRIKKKEDVIIHFLTSLFKHVKHELEMHHGYTDQCAVEFVLCVPPIWSSKASRTMHNAMAIALRKSGFISQGSQSVNNLFIVAEPEAAASYMLTTSEENHRIRV